MKSFFLPLFFATLLAGCNAVDSVKDGFAHSKAVSASLEKSIGLKSFVGFNWHNGSLTSVSVTFEGIPEQKPLLEIANAAKQAVLAEFKQSPQQIVIAFSIAP